MTEIILTSSVLILLTAILRRVLQGRIAPSVQYALWLLVAARLLIPGTLFTSPVSVVGAAENLLAVQAETVSGVPSAFIDPARPDGPSAYFVTQPSDETPLSPASRPSDGPASNSVTLPPEARQTIDWADLIWKAGIAVTGGAMLLSNLAFYTKIQPEVAKRGKM